MGDQYLSWLFFMSLFFSRMLQTLLSQQRGAEVALNCSSDIQHFHGSDNATGYRKLLRLSS